MTLVKLDSGDYINTKYVIKTMTDTAGSVGKKNGQIVYLLDTGYQKITPADKDRLVAAMTEEKLEEYALMLTNRRLVHAVSRRRYDYLTAPDTITTVTVNDERGLWLAKNRPELVKWVE